MPQSNTASAIAVLVAIVAIVMVAAAALIFVGYSDAGTQRIGILIGIIGLVLPSLVGMLRGDAAANRLNGELDARVAAAVLRANYVRRTSDVTPESAAPKGDEAIQNPTTLTPIDPTGPGAGG